MPTIADNLDELAEKTADIIAAHQAIADAIVAKGGTVNANDKLSDFPLDIATIPSGGGGGGSSSNAVNFYDYDGTIVNSYTATEFANLSAMPANPSHEGLTAQGWNWSLADAKTYVATYGKLNIGQIYVTSDGKTRLYISLPEGRTSPVLQLYLNENSELDIDWGDGSTHSTFTSTTADYKSERHEYSVVGDYVIAITVVNGGFVLQSSATSLSSILWNGNNSPSSPDRAYNNAIKKVEIGDSVTGIGSNAFRYCSSLSSVTIPNGVIGIGDGAFQNCLALSSIIIPYSVTSIGSNAFNYCSTLSSIIIPYSVTSIGSNAFQTCLALSSVTIPNGVIGISSYAFSNGYALSSITIPDSVTNIGGSAFQNCSSLSSITIPDRVTIIGGSAFANCSYMSYIKFESTTPPTVPSSNAWTNVSTSTKILVPTGTLETYKAAANYPNPSTYTYEEY